MAFEPKEELLRQSLEAPEKKETRKRRRVGRPSGKTKKNYSFTLKPSNRDLLDELAEKAGYTSASHYLDDWLEQQKTKFK